jgi:DNA (cytosine-5)-methyltransferase 1
VLGTFNFKTKYMKILIGCAGIGGESELWNDTENQITHVEIDPKIGKVISNRKPNRNVIIGDAFEYLLSHATEYDFIWFSPPCQGNSRMIRSGKNRKPRYPDLRLYEVKIFLDYNFKGKYVIENVKPYYKPVIEPTATIGRHLFWANFEIDENIEVKQPKNFINLGTVAGSKQLKEWLGINYEGNLYYGKNHDPCQVLRNCVHPKLGTHILNNALSCT